MRELFIYYRVREADLAAARTAVKAMQHELRISRPGLLARLLTRQGVDGGMQTWMETYSLAGEGRGFDAGFESEIEAHAARIAHLIDGIRHVEAFEPDLDA
ncbi:MAG: DUF4936 family protein [Caldimonas sp.]